MKTRLAHWRLMVALRLRSRPVWLLSFAASLGIVGAFFLPWLRLEGTPDSRNGAELLALAVSPSVNYLAEVSEIQLWVLIGCPALAIVAALIVVWQYGQRKTALFATSCVLAAALVAMYAPFLPRKQRAESLRGAFSGCVPIGSFAVAPDSDQGLCMALVRARSPCGSLN